MNTELITICLLSLMILTGLTMLFTHIFSTKKILRSLDKTELKLLHQIKILELTLQRIAMDVIDLNSRLNIAETRLQERTGTALFNTAVEKTRIEVKKPAKRGRPRKNAS